MLRSYGAAGLRHHLREHIALAAEPARRVDEHPRLQRVAPVSFALVCLRHRDGNGATDALTAAINAHPGLYVTPSTIDDTRFVRIAIGQAQTTAHDVERLWNAIADAS